MASWPRTQRTQHTQRTQRTQRTPASRSADRYRCSDHPRVAAPWLTSSGLQRRGEGRRMSSNSRNSCGSSRAVVTLCMRQAGEAPGGVPEGVHVDAWGGVLGCAQQAQVGVPREVWVDAALREEGDREALGGGRLAGKMMASTARSSAPTVAPYLHAHFSGATVPGLRCPACHLLQREQVGRAAQLLCSLAFAAAGAGWGATERGK